MEPLSLGAMYGHCANAYASLAELRLAHGVLLALRRERGETDNLAADIDTFIARGHVTGTVLDDEVERNAAQSLVDFWANVLYRFKGEAPEATLTEFDPSLAPELEADKCPFLGLNAFREADSRLFFGRQHLIAELISLVRRQRLIAVVGPSGSGKSSLVIGGLLAALQAGAIPGSADWTYRPVILPGSDPLANMVRAFTSTLDIADDTGCRHRSVFVVDQFEELFTLCDNEYARQAFIETLIRLVSDETTGDIVILTMRSDFESYVARVPALQALCDGGQLRTTPLSAAELREAIERPADLVGLKFEHGVVDRLISEVLGEPAGLPLLQFTLLKLWENRERNRVTMAAYCRLGGGRLALANSADAFYAPLMVEEQVTARRVLLRMVRPAEGLEITSSRIRRNVLSQIGEAPDRVDRVLQKMIGAQLVRVTRGETSDDDQIEIAHEALVRNWPRLIEWLEEERSEIILRRRLETKAAEWVRLGEGRSGLLDEVQLAEAVRWLGGSSAKYLGYDLAVTRLVACSQAAIEEADRDRRAVHERELDQARKLAEVERQRAEEQRRRVDAQAKAAKWLKGLVVALAVTAAGALRAEYQANAATRLAHQALKVDHLNRDAERLTTEGESLRHAGDLEKAADAYLRALPLYHDAGDKRRQAMVLSIVATIRLKQDKKEEAESLLLKALALQRESGQVTVERDGPLLQLARLYADQQKHEQATTLYEEALGLAVKTPGSNDDDLSDVLIGLGAFFQKQRRFDEAESSLLGALTQRVKRHGKQHAYVAEAEVALGELYRSEHKFERADQHFTNALSIQQKLAGPNRPVVADIQLARARLCREEGRYAQAEELFKEALRIYQSEYGAFDGNVANVLQALASMYVIQGRYADAEALVRRALSIDDKQLDTRNLSRVAQLGTILFYQQKWVESERLGREVLSGRQKETTPNHGELGIAFNNLAALARENLRYKEAESLYAQALDHYENIAPEMRPVGYGTSLNGLGRAYFRQGKYEQAEARFKQALEWKKERSDQYDLAVTLADMGRMYSKLAQYDQAAAYLGPALDILDKLSPTSPDLRRALTDYAAVLHATGRPRDALSVEQRIAALAPSAKSTK